MGPSFGLCLINLGYRAPFQALLMILVSSLFYNIQGPTYGRDIFGHVIMLINWELLLLVDLDFWMSTLGLCIYIIYHRGKRGDILVRHTQASDFFFIFYNALLNDLIILKIDLERWWDGGSLLGPFMTRSVVRIKKVISSYL